MIHFFVFQPIIDKWIRVYDDSPEVGTVQLLQLLITSSGCLGKIDINMIRTMELKLGAMHAQKFLIFLGQ